MTDVEATYEGFIGSRRTGRRNAVHDLPAAEDAPGGEQGPAAGSLAQGLAQGPAAGSLAQGLAQLNINKSGNEGEGSEKIQDSSAKEQESQAEDS